MLKPNKNLFKNLKSKGSLKAFTLFEILIVTFIISLVYVMFAISFQTNEKEEIGLKTLKKYIEKQKYKQYARIICLYNENQCRLYLDNKEKYESLFLFNNNKEIIVYDFDKNNELKEIKFKEFYTDEYNSKRVSLNMKFFSKNNHNPYLIDNGKEIIYFATFKNILTFPNIDYAKEHFNKNKNDLLEIYNEKIIKKTTK